jgi:diguanylate cyclase (GGDEF)-like protein
MKNDDLKTLVTQMYDNVLNQIDQEESTTKEQLLHYINDAIKVIESIKDDDISSAESIFNNPYKEIAKKSILSYTDTNGRFEELTQMQEDILNSESPHIDLPILSYKFDEIQTYMKEEVTRANETITQLSNQIIELEKTSNLDALTKILNRRALNTYLAKISKNDKKHKFHLLMLDIDDFKKINDNFGHVAGDKVLIYFANILKKTLRNGDKIFRYGGEEFVIILNNVDDIKCKAITQRLLELVRNNKLIYKGNDLSVTTSIGTTYFKENDTVESILLRSDKALYKAKSSGKNKICSEM